MRLNLLKSIFTPPLKTQEEQEFQHKRYYINCVLLAIFVPIWGVLLPLMIPGVVDYIGVRLISLYTSFIAFFLFKYNYHNFTLKYWVNMLNLVLAFIILSWVTSINSNNIYYAVGLYFTYTVMLMIFDSLKEVITFTFLVSPTFVYFNLYSVENTQIPISFILVLFLSAIAVNYYGLKNRFKLILELRLKTEEIKEQSQALVVEQEKSFQLAKLGSLGQLASSVAHEVNNPLMIADGFLRLLEKKISNEDDQIKNYIQKIITAHERIVKTVELLQSVTLNMLQEKKEICSIDEMFERLSATFEQECRLKNISLSFDLSNTTSEIVCHKNEIIQTLISLIDNSYDSLEIVQRENKYIEVVAEEKEEFIEFRVSDNGAGIEEKIKDKIFDPFFTTKDVNQGEGIHLSVARKVASLHAGEIDFKSDKNQTTFYFRISKLLLLDSSHAH